MSFIGSSTAGSTAGMTISGSGCAWLEHIKVLGVGMMDRLKCPSLQMLKVDFRHVT
jgi:hypothetical protein